MIAFQFLLLEPAAAAGIAVPTTEEWDGRSQLSEELRNKYPHFTVYVTAQAGRPMPEPASHWENARVVAKIPEENIRTITWDELDKLLV